LKTKDAAEKEDDGRMEVLQKRVATPKAQAQNPSK
jgi:hypothetical protein